MSPFGKEMAFLSVARDCEYYIWVLTRVGSKADGFQKYK